VKPASVIRAAMKRLGWDARGSTLSERSGVHITLVRRYLDDEVNVGAKNAPKLAQALGLSVEDVLYGTPPERAAKPRAA
jgi:hypothetical protein